MHFKWQLKNDPDIPNYIKMDNKMMKMMKMIDNSKEILLSILYSDEKLDLNRIFFIIKRYRLKWIKYYE